MKINASSIFSFFSGAGFLDLGFEMSGYNVTLVNEYYWPFLDGYKYSRRKMNIETPKYGYINCDIAEFLEGKRATFLTDAVKSERKHGLVGFIGGPPCPDFSVGGKNKGKIGDNGKLSGTYVELIVKSKPDFFLFENVKGLWLTKKHRAFYEELKLKLQKAGYATTERLINAIEFGAPQDRDRIILIGFQKNILKKGTCSGQEINGAFPWNAAIKYDKEKVFGLNWPDKTPFKENSSVVKPKEIPAELTVQYWFEKNNVSSHPNFEHCFKPREGKTRFQEVLEGDDSRKSFKRLHRWRYSPTACYGNNEVHLHPYKVRRINVAEALSIQSLPHNFELPDTMTLTDMFKTVGNGVPYFAAKGLANCILQFTKDTI